MRSFRELSMKAKTLFNKEDTFQLFIKFCEAELSDEEQKKINKWVHSYEDRQLIFEDLKKTIEFRKRLAVASEGNAKEILKDLKNTFPRHFSEIPDDTIPFILHKVLKSSVYQLNWEMCRAMVYGNKWIRIISLSVRVAIIILVLLITYELLLRRE